MAGQKRIDLPEQELQSVSQENKVEMSHHAVETDEAHPEGRAEKEGDKETEVVVEQTDRSLKSNF